jgi:son of sevenless-like protein
MSWNTISTGIAQAIYQLKESIQQQPSDITEQSTAIVHRVRGMLYACECLDKDTSVHLNNKALRNQHRSLLAALAKLALSAKASSDTKLQSDADDVLVAVRDFVTCAQDLGIDIKDTKPTLITTPPKVGIKNNSREVMLGLANTSRAAMASYLDSIHEALSYFVNNQDVQGTLERLKANAPLLVAQFRNVSNTTSHLLNAMDESPIKHAIYAAMGSLFILSQTITNARLDATQLTQIAQRFDHDAKALESGIHNVMESKPASLASESIHSLLLEEDDSEKTRRADIGLGTLMANPSGTLVPDDLSILSSTSELQRPSKEAKVDKFFGVDAAGRRRDTVMSPTSSYANGSETSWFLQSDIDSTDVVFNMDGNVKGGTLHALVQRLTQHDQLGM